VSARDLRVRVERRLHAAGVTLTAGQVDQLCLYFGLLAKWTKRLNLTSLTLEPPSDEAITRLLIEPAAASLAVAAGDQRLVDLGSGGGSPAIPLKVVVPRLQLVMVEAKARKAAFLRDATRQLALTGVEVANARFEELFTRPDLHEAADIVSVRAVRADRSLWNPVQAFLRPQGRVFWFASSGSTNVVSTPGLAVDSKRLLPGASYLIVLKRG
jgi:16S rRNA (guanine527-N7)-methyltransferase